MEIKKGRLPVRGLGWIKTENVAGTGVKGTLTYYDANKAKISSVDTSLLTGTNDWKLVHVADNVPTNAAYVTYMITSTTTAGSVYVDNVWLEEANLTVQNKYSINGLYLEKQYDAYGNKTSYQYDSYGNVSAETNTLGQTARMRYDADRKPIETIDRLGKISTVQYDAVGNPIKQINPLNQVTNIQYDEFNQKTVTELPNITKQAYDDTTFAPLALEVVNILEVDQYNELGQKVAIRNPNGRIVTFEYDKAGRVTKEVDPLKNEYRKFYDANSNVIKEESWAYDTATNTLYKKETTLHNIDELNRTVSSTDSSGDPTRIEEKSKFDAADREIRSVTGTGVTTDFQYDKEGRIIYTKENSTPALESWTMYDGLGTDAITMDLAGYETKVTDANGLLLEVVDAEGKRTKYTYNEVGDKTKQVSADGTETTWEYDSEGQLTRETVKLVQPDSSIKLQITEMEYDDLGQMTQTLFKEQTGTQIVTSKQETFVYDELGQKVKETILSNGKKTENRYYHDNNGNVTNVWIYDEQDPDGDGNFYSKIVYEYDNDDRLTSSSLTQSGITTRKSYNDKDKEETIQTALGKTTTTYDADDRPTQVINPIFDTYRYTYDVDDGLTRIEGPGVTTNLTYNGDKVSTLKGINGSGATVVDLAYTYNDLIQVSQITDKGVVKGKYTYTASGYLETVEANGTKIRYKQDANANFTEALNETTGKLKATYTYAQGNRITQRKEYNDTTGALLRTTDYTFNADGQVSQAKTVEGSTTTILDYLYTADSQLQVVNKTVNGVVQSSVSYEYDLEGNRIAKKVGNTRIEYQRDTEGEIFSIATITPTGDGDNNITNFNVYRDGNDSLTGFQHNNVPYYYQFNARGDVIAITNAAGTVVSTYEYDEWGNVTKITGDTTIANANPFRYVGKHGVQYDQDTGLYFMGWRDYDPTMGRYLVPDENEGDDENPASKNLYLYAEGDPVNNIDPDGHASSWWGSVWKVTKKVVKTVFADEIKAVRTLTNKNTSLWSKVKAAGSLVSSFTPGIGQIKKAYKAAKLLKKYGPKVYRYAKKAYRAGKKVQRKARKFVAPAVKKVRHYKAKVRSAVQRVKAKSKPRSATACARCFTAGTKVLSEDGEVPIEQLQLGQKVLATNPETGETEYKPIQYLFQREVQELYKIHVDGEVIETTDEHPFWIEGKGWVAAKDLQEGDLLVTVDGDTKEIDKIEVEKKKSIVYNFTVEDFHTYYVSDLKVLTHNQGCPRTEGKRDEPYILFNKKHSTSRPQPKGRGPSGGNLQSHHGLQDAWAKANIPGYSRSKAPTITLETGAVGPDGNPFPHNIISGLQAQRRNARERAGLGKWSSTIDEELGNIVSDLRHVGFKNGTIQRVLEQNYKMLDKLGVRYRRINLR